MSLQSINPTSLEAWNKLSDHFSESRNTHLKELFASDVNRASNFTLKWNDFLVDFSKNKISRKTIDLLIIRRDKVIEQDCLIH